MNEEVVVSDWKKFQAPGAVGSVDMQLQQIAAADGVSIPIRVYGVANQSTPIVLAHGLQSHSGWFVQSCSFLAEKGFAVYALDRRGSGCSKAPRGDCDDFQTM